MLSYTSYVLILALASQCECFCGEVDDQVPKVTVAYSTHLRVSWHRLFTGCTTYDVKNIEVVAEQSNDLSDTSKTFTADFEKKEALLALNPCLGYKIYIRIFSYSGGAGSYRTSNFVMYNDMKYLNIVHLYGGILMDEKFMERVCLKKKGVISLPDPPERVSECILTRADQENYEFSVPGQSHMIPLQILNPTNREPLTITAMHYGAAAMGRWY